MWIEAELWRLIAIDLLFPCVCLGVKMEQGFVASDDRN